MRTIQDQRGITWRIRLLLIISLGYVVLAGWVFATVVLKNYQEIRDDYQDGLEALVYNSTVRQDIMDVRYILAKAIYSGQLLEEEEEKLRFLNEEIRNKIIYTRSRSISPEESLKLEDMYQRYQAYHARWRESRAYLKLGYAVDKTVLADLEQDEAYLFNELDEIQLAMKAHIAALETKSLEAVRAGVGLAFLMTLLLSVTMIVISTRFLRETRSAVGQVEEKLNDFLHRSGSEPIVLQHADELTKIGEAIDLLIQAQERMIHQERLYTLGQLAGGIAHNLKTPVMAMAAHMRVLQRQLTGACASEAGHSGEKRCHKALAAADKMVPLLGYTDRVIDTLLQQSKGTAEEDSAGYTGRQLISQLQTLLEYEAKRHGAKVLYDNRLSEEDVMPGSLTALVQVMNNMVVNALQSYEAPGGTVVVRLSSEPEGIILSVVDEGCGIPTPILDKLLHEMVTTKGAAGSGLGLYISNLIVKAWYNGDIRITSQEGEGTVVSLHLPHRSRGNGL